MFELILKSVDWHCWHLYSHASLMFGLSATSFLSPLVPDKQFCRSMENLSNGAWRDKHSGGVLHRGHFPTLSLSSPTGHLTVPGGLLSPGGPMGRSQSSSNLPQNPYQDTNRLRPATTCPNKSYSQWDVTSGTRRHTEGNIQVTHIHCVMLFICFNTYLYIWQDHYKHLWEIFIFTVLSCFPWQISENSPNQDIFNLKAK